MTTRNIQTREGYDIWDKLCAIPTYGFLLAPEGSRVLATKGIGNWIDQHAAQVVVDEAQDELNELRAKVASLQADSARWKFFGERLAQREGITLGEVESTVDEAIAEAE